MNYTPNYHLPQWVKSDRIMMEDFNAMNGSIENGLTATAADSAQAVADAADAKQTANAAQQIAGNAYCPEFKPYAVGSYRGAGGKQEITVGFQPAFLIICCNASANDATSSAGRISAFGPGVTADRVTFTSTGFSLAAEDTSRRLPMVNTGGISFVYIAFR